MFQAQDLRLRPEVRRRRGRRSKSRSPDVFFRFQVVKSSAVLAFYIGYRKIFIVARTSYFIVRCITLSRIYRTSLKNNFLNSEKYFSGTCINSFCKDLQVIFTCLKLIKLDYSYLNFPSLRPVNRSSYRGIQ